MSESQIHGRIKYSISIELEASGCESIRDLPDSMVIRIDKGNGQTQGGVTHKPAVMQVVNVNSNTPHDKIELDSKLKLFMDIFHILASENRYDVKKEILIQELVDTDKFTEQEALTYIKKAQNSGFIFERRMTGTYAIA